MNFCSNCGSSNLKKVIPAGDNRKRIVCDNCNRIHYSNPKIVTGCLPVWGDQVLLCKRAIEPCKGLWNIPAGYLENHETVEAGAKREVWEEALAKVEIKDVLTLYSIPHYNQVYVLFWGQLINKEFGIGVESLESELFYETEIPWQQIAFTSSTHALQCYFSDKKKMHHHTHIGSI